MPRFVYEPADTHLNNELHVNKRPVKVGVPFDFDGNPLDDPKIAAHVSRVPGRSVAGERRPCIVALDAPPAFVPPTGRADEVPGTTPSFGDLLHLLGLPPLTPPQQVFMAVARLRHGFDNLAGMLHLAAGTDPDAVVDAIRATRSARMAQPSPAPTLDPNIPSDPRPGTLTGPPGPDVRAIQPGDAPVGPAVVDTDAMGITEPRRQYELADLPDTNAGLERIAAGNGVDLKRDDKRNRETRIAALRAAGLVAEG